MQRLQSRRSRRLRAVRVPRRRSRNRSMAGLRSRTTRDDPDRRVSARLSERVRSLHRPAAPRPLEDPERRARATTPPARAAPISAATAATSSSATSPGRRRVLAWVDESVGANGNGADRGAAIEHARTAARVEAGRPLAERRTAHAGALTHDDPQPRRCDRLRLLPRTRPSTACAARSARTSAASTHATRSTRARAAQARFGSTASSPSSTRSRVRPAASVDGGGGPAATRTIVASTSSACTPTSRGSSSSSSTRG